MTTFRNIPLVLFLLSLFIGYTISLQCYSCQGCDDPFDMNTNSTITVNGTGLYCKKTKGSYIVDRNITQGCSPFTAVGNGVWCCTTDLCNAASFNSFGRIILILNLIFFLKK